MPPKLSQEERDRRDAEEAAQERDGKINRARDALRTAMVGYETLLDVAQSVEKDDNKRSHYLASLIQVRSAKRVLWFEN